ncbi:hypothetical protein ACFL6S_17070 [Candidatus Poribacteria bacterium]
MNSLWKPDNVRYYHTRALVALFSRQRKTAQDNYAAEIWRQPCYEDLNGHGTAVAKIIVDEIYQTCGMKGQAEGGGEKNLEREPRSRDESSGNR